MIMNQEIITADGEIIEDGQQVATVSSMAVQLQKAEIDQLVSTARAYPRSLKRVQSHILSMATLDEESAEECIYALPRGGKPIRGPSIRFAEILKQSYGNCQSAARVVHVDKVEKYVEAEGIFIDLETNSKSTARVRRRISGRNGAVFNDDMIIVTGNAACSIAMRNAILAGVPKPLWRKAYDIVQATITGDITTLSENREKAFKALAAFGVKPEQICAALGVEGDDDITVDHIGTLRGMYSALKNGEATVEEMFVGTVKAVSDHTKIADPLSDKPIEAKKEEVAPTGTNEPAETETLSSGSTEQNTSDDSDLPSSDVAGEVSPGLARPNPDAADEAPEDDATGSTEPDESDHGFDEVDWLKSFARVIVASIGPDEAVVVDTSKGQFVEGLSEDTRARAKTIVNYARQACRGEIEPDDAKEIIAGKARFESAKELV